MKTHNPPPRQQTNKEAEKQTNGEATYLHALSGSCQGPTPSLRFSSNTLWLYHFLHTNVKQESGQRNAGWTPSKSEYACQCQNYLQGPPAEKEEDFC